MFAVGGAWIMYCLIRSFRPIRVPLALELFPSLLGGHSSTSASAVMYDACPRQHSHSLPSQVCLRLYETTSSVTNCSEQVAQLDGAI